MKKIIFLMLIVTSLLACHKKEAPPLTKQEIQHKIDSITHIRIKELDDQARQDLSRRIKIEVKVKVDSILNVKALQQSKDTTAKNAVVSK